jgi:hypothetical protein
MNGVIFIIPFAVFFACTLGQFFMLRRVRQALVARHPEIWLELSRKAIFTNSTGLGFALRRGDRGLDDPELSRSVNLLLLLWAVAIGAWIVLMGLILFTSAAVRAG